MNLSPQSAQSGGRNSMKVSKKPLLKMLFDFETASARIKSARMITLIITTVSLILLFAAYLACQTDSMVPDTQAFLQTMRIIMSAQYGIVIMATVPLFVVLMRLLKKTFFDLYSAVKVKAAIVAIVYLIVLTFRFVCYLWL